MFPLDMEKKAVLHDVSFSVLIGSSCAIGKMTLCS